MSVAPTGVPTMTELFEQAARTTSKLCFQPSGEIRSLADVSRHSVDVARWITATVGTGGAVGALLSNTPDCPASVLGVWRSGNTLVSLPHPGRGVAPETYLAQVAAMCEAAGAELVLVDEAYRALIPPLPVRVATYQEALAGGPACDTDRAGGLIQFTSGSVGRPKGVVLPSERIATNVLGIIDAIDISPGDVACSWLPMSHDMGFIGMFLTSVGAIGQHEGLGDVHLLTPEYFLSDPSSWLRTCSEAGVTITTAPDFAFQLATRVRGLTGPLDLSSLRVCITGAERVNASTLRRFTAEFADTGFRPSVLCPAYGMAEATLAVTMVRPDEQWRSLSLDRAALGAGKVLPATGEGSAEWVGNGAPVAGLEVRIAPDAPGDVGEVQVRGASMLTGYVGADLRLTPDGWFPTRDIGFLDEGELFLIGRSDDTIIVGGRNHYAVDIEAVVDHPIVRPGCLAAVPLETGYALVAEARGEPDRAALETACRELAVTATRSAGLRPALVGFVPRGRLPKTPSGKIQRRQLAAALTADDLETLARVTFD